jgi:hypothetical protein
MPTTPFQIALDYTHNMLTNVDSLHGQPNEEPQKGLIEHALVRYNPVRRLFLFAKSDYSLTPKGRFVLSEIERERNKTSVLENKAKNE